MPFIKGHKYYGKGKKREPEAVKPMDTTTVHVTTADVPISPAKAMDSVALVKNNLTRHTIGMMTTVEAMFGSVFTPKCRKCYNERGWLTKCVCLK